MSRIGGSGASQFGDAASQFGDAASNVVDLKFLWLCGTLL
jgi:hypothetical protein